MDNKDELERERTTTPTSTPTTPPPTDEEPNQPGAAAADAAAAALDPDGVQCPICFADYEPPSVIQQSQLRTDDVDVDDVTTDTFFQQSQQESSPESQPVLFVHGPCRHVFCQSCLERHLLRSSSSSSQRDVRYAPLETPTLGRCPVCRREIYLLDVVAYQDSTNGQEQEHEIILPVETESDGVVGSNSSIRNNNSSNSVYEKNTDCASWPVAGMVFAERQQGGVGFGSFHFPPHTVGMDTDDTDNDNDMDETEAARLQGVPYMDTTKFPLANRNRQVRLPFVTSTCHYHAPTRTFRGSLHIPSDAALQSTVLPNSGQDMTPSSVSSSLLPMYTESDVLVQFSPDFSYISTGVIIKRRQVQHQQVQAPQQQQQQAHTNSVLDQTRLVRTEHPLDGRWRVDADSNSNGESRFTERAVSEIDITGRSFYDAQGDFYVAQILAPDNDNDDNDEDTALSCRIVDASTLAAVWGLPRSEWDRSTTPMGPEPGESLRWTRIRDDDADNTTAIAPVMIWTRLTFKDTMPPDICNRLGGDSGCLYQRVMTAQERAARQLSRSQPPTYHDNSIWGNTFVQALRVGLASYHFISAGGGNSTTGTEPDNNTNADADDDGTLPHVYISYEHPATAQWPPLDNGRPLPSRVRFHNVSFPTPHTFRGEIRWQEDYGTPWQGMVRWVSACHPYQYIDLMPPPLFTIF
jgi:hypothetical protein